MSERIRAWLEDFAHVFTIVSALVVLGVGTVISVTFQAVLAALFGLSLAERALLGTGAFIVILAVVFAVLKFVWQRRLSASEVTSETDAGREVQELKAKLDERVQQIDELEQQLAANRSPQQFNVPATTGSPITPGEANDVRAENREQKKENEELKAQLEEAQQTIRSQRTAMEDEHGHVNWGQAKGVNLYDQIADAKAKKVSEELGATNEPLREEKHQIEQERDSLRRRVQELETMSPMRSGLDRNHAESESRTGGPRFELLALRGRPTAFRNLPKRRPTRK